MESKYGSNYFGNLSPRMQTFRDELLDVTPEICVERAEIVTKSYKRNQNKPLHIKRALMLRDILENMSIYIEDSSLIAGNQASSNRAAPIFPEYAMSWVIDELEDLEKRDGDVFIVSEENKEKLRNIYPYWENNTIYDKGKPYMPDQTQKYADLGIISFLGKVTSGDGHFAADYTNMLRVGLKDYKIRAGKKLSELDLSNYKNIKKSYFYKSCIIVIDAVRDFALRYSKLAEKMVNNEDDAKRKEELLEISNMLKRVPYEPATSFKEAVQSVWLIHLILQIESNGHSVSYGRVDQYLNPYLESDLSCGKLTEDEASEILVNLWLKTYSINKVRPWGHTEFSAGSPLYQNVTIGGQTKDKKDASNKSSWLILKTIAQCHLPQPNLTVRYHKNLPNDFMKECLEVIRCGFGMPAFNSDEVIIPSFIEKGVKEKDAYNYCAVGCVETAVPGKWGYRCTGMSFLNFPKGILIAMNGGKDPSTNIPLIEDVKEFKDLDNFDEFMDSWNKTIREMAKQTVIVDSVCDMLQEENTADILASVLTDDCIGRGLTMKEGGSVYDFISGLQVGIANTADSFAAIKKTVFDDKTVGKEELWTALMDNFESPKGKEIRQLLIAAPKYGNDDDYVDLLGTRAYDSYIDEIKKAKNTRYGRGPVGGVYYAGTSSISANVPQGASTLATPDGRRKGEALAEGCSPSHGCDVNGPTAVLKSVSKLPTKEITGGVLLNQKVTPTMLDKKGNKEKLQYLTRSFFNGLDGYHIQYNVVDKETLIDAQNNPQKHKNLVVRVAGYSAFFNSLSKNTQDDIIARTEQTI
ncbi:glycyl radical protein [uncultured Anaerococcus sp.]|uniref:glycyl radical protein n=1 Tax=uncultured Anaerococcus sp. TaxID=293428 RepID=UPI002633861A|nr:glycyl radical protein [uncultured Anaerococcus sp.]